jgi:hypothetical protein
MGFGFNLFFVFILFPLTGVFLVIWHFTKKKIIGKTLGWIWLGILALVMLSGITQWLFAKTILEKKDYYGEYIVNLDYFPGKQSDWQYEHFRFEIKENDSIYFHVTDKTSILKTFAGKITMTEPYNSARIRLNMEQPTHHIVVDNPTTYRSAWSFYLVFHSSKFNNMFFKKGQWKALDK